MSVLVYLREDEADGHIFLIAGGWRHPYIHPVPDQQVRQEARPDGRDTGADEIYDEAIDPADSGRTYNEMDEPIELTEVEE